MAVISVIIARIVYWVASMSTLIGSVVKIFSTGNWWWLALFIGVMFVMAGLVNVVEKIAGEDAAKSADAIAGMTAFIASVGVGAAVGAGIGYALLSWFGVIAGVIIGAVVGGFMYLDKK